MLTVAERSFVIRAADRAPSLHGSRPWRVVAHSSAVDILATPGSVGGPSSSGEALTACGAASLHAQLALAELGRRCRVHVVPDPERPDLAVRLLPAPLGWSTPDDVVLLPATHRQPNYCGAFAAAPVTAGTLAQLGVAAARDQVWVQVLSGSDVLELACLQALAQDGAPHVLAEVLSCASWAHSESDEVRVPGWAATNSPDSATGSGEVLLVLGTSSTSSAAQVAAGRALARLILTASTLRLGTAPAHFSTALPTVRDAMLAALAPLGTPLLLVRAGHPIVADRDGGHEDLPGGGHATAR